MKSFLKTILVTFLFFPGLLLAEVININTADKETLMTVMKGVGEKRAQAIINYREKNGPFESVDELVNISGIGESTIEDNRDKLTVENK